MPINFSDELLRAAQTSLQRISTCAANLKFNLEGDAEGDGSADEELIKAVDESKNSFIAHMDDDLNTADAITDIFGLVKTANTAVSSGKASKAALKQAYDTLLEITGVLGIELSAEEDNGIPAEITELVEQRAAAKKNKDFAEADRIRDLITSKGYSVKDTPQGPQVEKL